MREDILPAVELEELSAKIAATQEIRRKGTAEQMRQAETALEAVMERINPTAKMDWWRTNFDVMVVALSVAMCFRAFYYQPFKIPTGSMQPTLYGIHSVEKSGAEWYDNQPFLFIRWLGTGESYHEIRAQASGEVHFMRESAKPGYVELRIGGIPHFLPSDAVMQRRAIRLRSDVNGNPRAVQGDVLWSGRIVSGDFLFVNRWLWNFRHPRRGEVMVFSTNGINGLQQGTHYIKRMCGVPNERLTIKAPQIYSNDEPIVSPAILGKIARKEKLADWAVPYAGFNPAQSDTGFPNTIAADGGSVVLGPRSYYAMGDNSFNSYDSRYWGPVPERNLLGPAAFVHWPFTSPRWGSIP